MMNTVNILVSSDTNYIPQLGVMLHSLITSRTGDYLLAVHLLHDSDELDEVMLGRLKKQLRGYDGVTLNPVDITGHPEISGLHPGDGYAAAAYYRLLAPVLLPDLEKALYLDCDLVVKHDIAELYNTDLGDCLAAVCKDVGIISRVSCPVNNTVEYMEYLGITNKLGYFNSGVMLLNLAIMRKEDLCPKMVRYARRHDCFWVDQDVLNYFCQGRVQYLDISWNSQQGSIDTPESRYAPFSELKNFLYKYEDEKIAHFAAHKKPWKDAGVPGAEKWWAYAEQTGWHEMLRQQLDEWQNHARNEQDGNDRALSRIYNTKWLRRNLAGLIKWNEVFLYAELIDLALEREKKHETDKRVFERLVSSKVIFYGAGYWCRCILDIFDKLGLGYPSEIWDKKAGRDNSRLHGIAVRKPDLESLSNGNPVAVTIEDIAVNREIAEKYENTISHKEIKAALAYALLMKKKECDKEHI